MSAHKAKAATRDGWGILNRFGDLWSPAIFDTQDHAKAYFDKYWAEFPKGAPGVPPAWTDYKVVWCRQRTAPIREPKQVRP